MSEQKRYIRTVLAGIIGLFLLGTVVSADPRITESQESGEGVLSLFVNGLPEGAQVKGASAQIGTEAAEITGESPAADRMPVQTLLMLDNSRSMRSFQESRELLKQIVDQHAPGELFRFVTFSKAIVKTTDEADVYSDNYDAVKAAIDGVQSENLETLVNNALFQAIQELSGDPTESYKRIIIVSDGGDKSTSGNITQEEVIRALYQYPLPVYCIGSQWDNSNAQGLSEFSALGREFGAFVDLDEVQDVNEVVQIEKTDYNAWIFDVDIPDSLQDGDSRNVRLSIDTDGGPAVVTGSVVMPFLNTEAAAVSEPEPAQEPIVVTDTPTPGPTPTEAPEEEKKEIPWLWISIGGGVLLLLLILLVVLLLLRKRKKEAADVPISDVEYFPPGGDGETELFMDGTTGTRTIGYGAGDEGDEATQLMFGKMDEVQLILTDVRDPSRRYSAKIKDGIIAGKSTKSCQLVINGDSTISRQHCRFTTENGRVYMEDMESTNGTWLNRKRIYSVVEISDGDTIRIGNTELTVELR